MEFNPSTRAEVELDKVALMNPLTHRKQIFLLVLPLGLAISSYWIPLPSEPQARNSARTETATQYALVTSTASLATR